MGPHFSVSCYLNAAHLHTRDSIWVIIGLGATRCGGRKAIRGPDRVEQHHAERIRGRLRHLDVRNRINHTGGGRQGSPQRIPRLAVEVSCLAAWTRHVDCRLALLPTSFIQRHPLVRVVSLEIFDDGPLQFQRIDFTHLLVNNFATRRDQHRVGQRALPFWIERFD